MSWVDLCASEDISAHEIHAMKAGAEAVLVLKNDTGIHVYEDRCSHQDIPLSDFGQIDGEEIICLAHGARFCINSGAPKCEPAKTPLVSYKTKVENGRLLVDIANDS